MQYPKDFQAEIGWFTIYSNWFRRLLITIFIWWIVFFMAIYSNEDNLSAKIRKENIYELQINSMWFAILVLLMSTSLVLNAGLMRTGLIRNKYWFWVKFVHYNYPNRLKGQVRRLRKWSIKIQNYIHEPLINSINVMCSTGPNCVR